MNINNKSSSFLKLIYMLYGETMNISSITSIPNKNLKPSTPNKISSYINQDRLKDTFVKITKVDTGSCEATKVSNAPSTQKQVEFAKQLANDLKEIGLSDIGIDENGILTATMKGNIGEDAPVVGLIAHMDTSE